MISVKLISLLSSPILGMLYFYLNLKNSSLLMKFIFKANSVCFCFLGSSEGMSVLYFKAKTLRLNPL